MITKLNNDQYDYVSDTYRMCSPEVKTKVQFQHITKPIIVKGFKDVALMGCTAHNIRQSTTYNIIYYQTQL